MEKSFSDFDLADPFVLNPPVASTADYDDDENWNDNDNGNDDDDLGHKIENSLLSGRETIF